MNAKKINWGEIFRGSDIEVLGTFYAFASISNVLEKRGYDKEGVSSLKLTLDDKQVLTEEGFREFLKSITALTWQDEELTKADRMALSSINEYLREPYVQVGDKESEGVTFDDLIADMEAKEVKQVGKGDEEEE